MIAIMHQGDNYAPEIKIHLKFKYLLAALFCVMTGANQTFAQEKTVNKPITITGTVVSAVDGQALQRATVKIKSTNQTIITNEKGEFSFTIDKLKGILEISFLGYTKQEIPFDGTGKPILINLEKDEQQLEEVEISTGYQTFSPERFVGSASKLDSADFHRRVGMSVIERLKGTVTGLQFGKETGTSAITYPMIRGISTLSPSNKPLIVVDNFPMDDRFDLNSINTNDIQDITVLKDAVAASIWGSASGNGVIVITTKKGKFNQPFTISASSNAGITEKPDFYYYPRMSIDEVIDVERFLFDKGFYKAKLDNVTTRPIISPVVELLNQMTEANAASINQQIEILSKQDIRRDLDKYLYQHAIRQQHHLSIGGGNNLGAYSFSAGYNQSLSNRQNTKAADQFTIRSQNTFKPVKNLTVEAGIQLSKNISHHSIFPTLPTIPYQLLADEHGNALPADRFRSSYIETLGNGKLLDWHYRPLDEIRLANNDETSQFINLNLAATVQFVPWLKGTARFQHQQHTNYSKDYFSEETFMTRDLINRFTQITGNDVKYIVPRGGIMDVRNNELISNNFRGQLDFNHQWQGKHRLSGIIASDISRAIEPFKTENRFFGYDIEKDTYSKGLDYSTRYTLADRIAGTMATIPQGSTIGSGQISNRVSFLGNASYTYDNRYNLYASARKDGANVFGVHTNNKWKPLWSAGASWDISKEAFFQVNWISYLRLRSSYGYMGNTTIGSGLTTIRYQPTAPTITDLPQASIGNPPNPDLRWEEVRTINAGLDFNIFKGRLSGSLEGFQKQSKDILSDVPFDPTTGVALFLVNSASLKGKGMELNLSSQNSKGPVEWNSTFGYSFVKTSVTEMYNGKFKANDFISYGLNAAVDQIAFGLSSYRWAGLDPDNGDPRGYLNGELSKNYKAIAADSIQNQVFHGSSIPLHFGFLGNSVSYKNISLSANINFTFDYYFRKPTLSYFDLFNSLIGHVDYQARWQKTGDEAITDVPSMIYPNPSTERDNFYKNTEVHVLRADHIRLRDLRLQYQLDRSLIPRLPIKSVQFFLYANNLNVMIWRKNKSNHDPDFLGGTSFNSSPAPKSLSFGINLTL